MSVFLVGCTLYANGSCEHENVQVFTTLPYAARRFKQLVVADIKESDAAEWKHDELDAAVSSNYYESWKEGERISNNCHIWLRETELEY